MSGKARDPKERFFEKVNKTSNCWEWTAGTFSNGYGQFFDGISKICAHRFSYQLIYGEIKDKNLEVCHKCDNRKCVNPNHLFLGTQKQNIEDMCSKGRHNPGKPKGTINGRAILIESKVLEMRSLYSKGTSIAEIARRYDTSETQTARIVKIQSWKHI